MCFNKSQRHSLTCVLVSSYTVWCNIVTHICVSCLCALPNIINEICYLDAQLLLCHGSLFERANCVLYCCIMFPAWAIMQITDRGDWPACKGDFSLHHLLPVILQDMPSQYIRYLSKFIISNSGKIQVIIAVYLTDDNFLNFISRLHCWSFGMDK